MIQANYKSSLFCATMCDHVQPCVTTYNQGRIELPEAARGHATVITKTWDGTGQAWGYPVPSRLLKHGTCPVKFPLSRHEIQMYKVDANSSPMH